MQIKFNLKFDEGSGFTESYLLSSNPPNLIYTPYIQIKSLIIGQYRTTMSMDEWKQLVQAAENGLSGGSTQDEWKSCVNEELKKSRNTEEIYVDFNGKLHKYTYDPFEYVEMESGQGSNLRMGYFEVEAKEVDLSFIGCFRTMCNGFIFVAVNDEYNHAELCNSKCNKENFEYFALSGNQCKCGHSLHIDSCPKHVEDKVCNIPCNKITQEYCGSDGYVRIYKSWTGIVPKELGLVLSFKMYPLLIHPILFDETKYMESFQICSEKLFLEWYIGAISSGCSIDLDTVILHDLWSTSDAS